MHGSYVVNEAVKGGGRVRPASYSPRATSQSYKKCMCLIATVFVFIVAAVIVLLALNSAKKEVTPNRDGLINDRKNTNSYRTRPATTERIIPNKDIDGREWMRKSGPIRNWPNDEFTRKRTSIQRLPTTTTLPIHRIVFSERLPETPPPQQPPKNPRLLITSTTTARNVFLAKQSQHEENDLAPAEFEQDQDPSFIQQQQHTEQDRVYFPGQQHYQKLRNNDDEWTTEQEQSFSLESIKNDPIDQPMAHSTTTSRTVPTTIKWTTTSTPANIKERLQLYPDCPKTCNTLQCTKSMSSILMRIDFDQDPCEDFYKYACNGLAVHEISPPSMERRFRKQINKYLAKDPRPDAFISKYKTFYESCLAYKCDGTTDPVVKFFRPLMNSVAPDEGLQDEKAHNLTHLIGRILLDGRLSSRVIPLFDVDLDFDATFGPMPVITMPTHPSLLQTAHSGDLYVVNCRVEAEKLSQTETSSAKIIDAFENCLRNNTNYIKVLEKAMRIFEIFSKLPEFDREQRLKKIIMTIEWEVLDVLKRLTDREIVQEESDYGSLMTMDQLTALCPVIEWNVLFPILFDGSKVERVKVLFNDRLEAICKIYSSMDYDVLHDVILSMLAHDWYVEFMRPTQIPSRESYCEKLSHALMQDVVSNVFMTHVPLVPLRSFEQLARELFTQLKENLIASISSVSWITKEEKDSLISQIVKLDIVDNYPALLKQDSNVVSNMVLYMSPQDFVSNVLVLKRRTRTIHRNYHTLSKTTIFSQKLAMEVQFIPGMNLLFVPLPLVNSFVDNVDLSDFQKYELYANLGYMIGQALMRPLELNQLKKLLLPENEDLKNYEDFLLTESPIRSFKGAPLQLDLGSTNISMNSRFADDASLRLTLETYEKQKLKLNDLPFLNAEDSVLKTYFLGVAQQFCVAPQAPHDMVVQMYTQKHLPNHLRVNSMMMNSVAFKNTFSCPVGSVMNPVLKNQQFPYIDESNFRV